MILHRSITPTDIKVVSNFDNLDNRDLSKIDFTFIDVKKNNIEIVEILFNIKNIFQKLKIMVLDFNKDREVVLTLTKLGIDGYIINVSDEDKFIYVAKKVMSGKKFYDSELLKYVLNKPINSETQKLTNRELDVLKQVAKSLSNKNIVDNLNVTDYTIKKYVNKILSKLSLRNRQDIVIYVRDNELIGSKKAN